MGRRLRIISGLVLFAFVATHLVNVALGLHSIALMDRARPILLAPWSNILGTLVLTASLVVHLALGLVALYQRNTLRMPASDAVQLLASLAVIPLLTPHVVGTAVAARFGIVPTYDNLIPYFWIHEPLEGLRQVLLLTAVWVHGCVGVYTWARIQPWWPRFDTYLYPVAVAIPVLALLGFVEAGNQAIDRWNNPPAVAMQDDASGSETPAATPEAAPAPVLTRPFDEILAILKRINWTVFYLYMGLVAAILIARHVRLVGARGRVRVTFVDGGTADAETGLSLLEIARSNNVPVAQLCRGRGRCGTCRVRLAEAPGDLPPPGEVERETLERVGAGADMRLACQLKPTAGYLTVERVLPPYLSPRDLHRVTPARAEAPEVAAVDEGATPA